VSPLSSELEYLSCRDWRLAHLIDFVGPIVRHNDETAFSFLAQSIVGQMLSLKAAATIESRLLELCNGTLSFASVAECTVDEIRAIGISSRKASYLLDLATTSTEEDLAALSSLSDDGVREALERHRGIGRWTSNMFLLFFLDRPDILPVEDVAFQQAFRWLYDGAPVTNPDVERAVCGLWHPFASLPVRYLYRALDLGLTRRGPSREVLGY